MIHLKSLKKIGAGSERTTYMYEGNALKVSRYRKEQHDNELLILDYLDRLEYSHLAPKLISHGENYLLVEYLSPTSWPKIPTSEVFAHFGVDENANRREERNAVVNHYKDLIDKYGYKQMYDTIRDMDDVYEVHNVLIPLYTYNIEAAERFIIDCIKASKAISRAEDKNILIIQDMNIENFTVDNGEIKIIDLGLPIVTRKDRSW